MLEAVYSRFAPFRIAVRHLCSKRDVPSTSSGAGITQKTNTGGVKPMERTSSLRRRLPDRLAPALEQRMALMEDQQITKPITYYDSLQFNFIESCIVWISLAILVAYVFVRPPNDFDEYLSEFFDRPLWQDVPVLEKKTLEQLINEGKVLKKDTSQYEQRLAELLDEMERKAVEKERGRWYGK